MPRFPAMLLISLATSLLICPVSASTCGNIAVLSGSKDDGTRVELNLDSERVEKTPSWRPGQGEPPFSVGRAIEVGSAWAKDHYKRFDSVEIAQISLYAFGCSTVRDHWYYVLEFTPVMDGNRMFGSFNWAAVLFDGTVVGTTESKPGSR